MVNERWSSQTPPNPLRSWLFVGQGWAHGLATPACVAGWRMNGPAAVRISTLRFHGSDSGAPEAARCRCRSGPVERCKQRTIQPSGGPGDERGHPVDDSGVGGYGDAPSSIAMGSCDHRIRAVRPAGRDLVVECRGGVTARSPQAAERHGMRTAGRPARHGRHAFAVGAGVAARRFRRRSSAGVQEWGRSGWLQEGVRVCGIERWA